MKEIKCLQNHNVFEYQSIAHQITNKISIRIWILQIPE